jgi:hypothetical protein
MPVVEPGKTFCFAPGDGQVGSLEYKTYSRIIAKKLSAHGWVESDSGADYLIHFSYAIGDGKNIAGSMPIIGQTGGGTGYVSGNVRTTGGRSASYTATTYTPPTFGEVGQINYNYTNYTRTLSLAVADAKKILESKGMDGIIFEANVRSTGRSGSVAEIMPTMIEALFKEFPGKSGKTKRVDLSLRPMPSDLK